MADYQPIQISPLTNEDLKNELDSVDSIILIVDALNVANDNKENELCKTFINMLNTTNSLRGTNWKDIAKLILVEKYFGQLK